MRRSSLAPAATALVAQPVSAQSLSFDLSAMDPDIVALGILVISLVWLVLLLSVPVILWLWRIRREVSRMRALQQAMASDLARAAKALELLASESARVMMSVQPEPKRPGGLPASETSRSLDHR